MVLPILQGLDPLVSLPPHRRVVLTHAQMRRARYPRETPTPPPSVHIPTAVLALAGAAADLSKASAVLHPKIDSPERVDAIVLVAGAKDDRYVYAHHPAEAGITDRILVSQPPAARSSYATAPALYCAS